MGWMMAHGTDEDDKLDLDETRKVLRRTAKLVRPYRRWVVAAVLLLAVWTGTTLAGPLLVRRAIDQGLAHLCPGELRDQPRAVGHPVHHGRDLADPTGAGQVGKMLPDVDGVRMLAGGAAAAGRKAEIGIRRARQPQIGRASCRERV